MSHLRPTRLAYSFTGAPGRWEAAAPHDANHSYIGGPAMNGNFNPTQNLQHDDQTVDTKGWLTWDAGDQSAVITITVTQNTYSYSADPITCQVGSNSWEAPVTCQPPDKWAKGAASGSAAAVVTRQDGSTYDKPWTSPPLTLH
jgi:hypothetical protein